MIEIDEIHVFTFSDVIQLTHLKCGIYGIPMTGAVRVFASMFDEQQQCSICLWLFFGGNKLSYADFDSALLIRLFHVSSYFILSRFW